MAEGEDDRSWWRRTCVLALVAVGGGGILGLGTVALAPSLDTANVAGIPNGLFAGALLVPVVVLLLIFWSAERQRRIDERHGFFED
jgi:putative solute:sodium symporter small subunit